MGEPNQPAPAFDPLIHAPHRLRVCAMLYRSGGIEFSEIQRRAELTKSALSKHLAHLSRAGYLQQQHILRSGRSRLLVALTETGRRAYTGHLVALEEIIAADDTG